MSSRLRRWIECKAGYGCGHGAYGSVRHQIWRLGSGFGDGSGGDYQNDVPYGWPVDQILVGYRFKSMPGQGIGEHHPIRRISGAVRSLIVVAHMLGGAPRS